MSEADHDSEELFEAAVAAHQSGRLESAEQLYRQVIDAAGEDAVTLELLGVVLVALGRVADGMRFLDRSLSLDDSSPTAWLQRAEARMALGDREGAESDLRACLVIDPDLQSAALRLAMLCAESGRHSEAGRWLDPWRSSLAEDPAVAIAEARLRLARCDSEAAMSCLPEGTLDEASAAHAAAIRFEIELLRRGASPTIADSPLPDAVLSQCVARSAVALLGAGRLPEAVTACISLRQTRPQAPDPAAGVMSVLSLHSPELSDAFRQALAMRLFGDVAEQATSGLQALAAGDIEQAISRLGDAVAARPDLADLSRILASLLIDSGRAGAAIPIATASLEHSPNDAGLHHELGRAMIACHRLAEAEAALRQAISTQPDRHGAKVELASLLSKQGRLEESLDLSRTVPAESLFDASARSCAADCLAASLRQSASIETLLGAVSRYPEHAVLQSQLLYMQNFPEGISDADLASEHRHRASLMAPLGEPPRSSAERRSALAEVMGLGRRIRLGILSPDLRRHSVWYFLEPLLETLDRDRFEVISFSTGALADEATARIRRLSDEWHQVDSIDDQALMDHIRRTRIDLLFELSGHTNQNRLCAIAHRVAPVQITYLGYPNTTGIGAMDFRVVDHITDPAGAESLATETLLRTSRCFLCFMPDPTAPSPMLRRPRRPIIFGCFNNLAKVTRTTLETWAAALMEVPDSRLLVKSKSFHDQSTAHRLISCLSDLGIDPARVRLLDRTPDTRGHLALYDEIDVALDTYPYNGTTTTCEALSMGVPVVTLAGSAHRARVGASLLHWAGMPEMVATDVAGFGAIAALAAERADRPRSDLLADSSLRRPELFVADLVQTLESASGPQ
jgi:protein O-GlcNAc transferase